MNITETAIDAEMLSQIHASAAEGAELLGLNPAELSPDEVVAGIDIFIFNRQSDKGSHRDDDSADVSLGSLWGEQLVREFGWQWSSVTFHDYDGANAVGVFSPDRSLVIYPYHFIYSCLENDAPVTILLAFDVLKDGTRIPALPAGGFENVMDNVHHPFPRG
jgi:hypothetical protein